MKIIYLIGWTYRFNRIIPEKVKVFIKIKLAKNIGESTEGFFKPWSFSKDHVRTSRKAYNNGWFKYVDTPQDKENENR